MNNEMNNIKAEIEEVLESNGYELNINHPDYSDYETEMNRNAEFIIEEFDGDVEDWFESTIEDEPDYLVKK